MRSAWNHNLQYHDFVLQQVSSTCGRALDIGCGEGLLLPRLASRCNYVTGIDLAVAGSAAEPDGNPVAGNVKLLAGDVMTYPFPLESFHCVIVVATLHHLPLNEGLERMRRLLRPGGTLVIIGLYRLHTPMDYAYAVAGHLTSRLLRLRRRYVEVQAATTAPKQTLQEVREAADAILVGNRLARRLFFRYSLVWRKPE